MGTTTTTTLTSFNVISESKKDEDDVGLFLSIVALVDPPPSPLDDAFSWEDPGLRSRLICSQKMIPNRVSIDGDVRRS